MKEIGKICITVIVLLLGACTPYDPFELSKGELTVQEALGYKSDAPYMAVAASSKHYQITDSTSYSSLYDGINYGANGNENGILNPGETVFYKFRVANYGKKPVYGVSVVILTDDKYVSNMANDKGDIGHFKECGRYSPEYRTIFFGYENDKNLRFTVSPDAPPGHVIKFEIVFTDASYNIWRDYFLITVYR
jgi:hypothetical protein